MTIRSWPWVIDVTTLAPQISDALVLDLGKSARFSDTHLPGAVHLEFDRLLEKRPPVGGLLPDEATLAKLFSELGLSGDQPVLAYDDEGGGRAARALWTLDVLGHRPWSYLDGGLAAWTSAGFATESGPATPSLADYRASIGDRGFADKDYVLSRLGAEDVVIVDTRSPNEYAGTDLRTARGGHIPGAVNFDWVLAKHHDQRLRGGDELRGALRRLGISEDKEVIVYCQTHHRSSHTYVALKHLGYTRIRGYAGAWSEWGNASDTPIEVP